MSAPSPTIVGGEECYGVQAILEILDSRMRAGKLEFLAGWKGYD